MEALATNPSTLVPGNSPNVHGRRKRMAGGYADVEKVYHYSSKMQAGLAGRVRRQIDAKGIVRAL